MAELVLASQKNTRANSKGYAIQLRPAPSRYTSEQRTTTVIAGIGSVLKFG